VPTFSRIFIDDILVGKKKEWFTLLLIGMGMTALMRAGLTWLQQYFLMRFDMKLAIVDSSRFFWHVLRLPVEFFTQRYGGEIGNRVEINDKVARLLSSDISTTILDLIMAIFFAFLLFQYDVLLTLIGILIASINIVFLKYISGNGWMATSVCSTRGASLSGP
jgi:ABC-type bacteriocin/lantibiotic exporter with double-glycine peptidase domain